MQRKHIILTGLAGALVVLNLWRWLPDSAGTSVATAQNAGAEPVTVESLKLRGVATATGSSAVSQRDLFARFVPAAPVQKKTPIVQPAVKVAKKVSTANRAKKAARAGMGEYQLVGIVIRPGKSQAFLLKGDTPYDVGVGDVIDGRIRVQKVSAAEVILKDDKTNVTRIMPLADK